MSHKPPRLAATLVVAALSALFLLAGGTVAASAQARPAAAAGAHNPATAHGTKQVRTATTADHSATSPAYRHLSGGHTAVVPEAVPVPGATVASSVSSRPRDRVTVELQDCARSRAPPA